MLWKHNTSLTDYISVYNFTSSAYILHLNGKLELSDMSLINIRNNSGPRQLS